MAATATVKSRKIYKEDVAFTATPTPATENAHVLGAGTVALTKLDAVLYSAFGQYANDGAAAAGGVLVGQIYFNTTNNKLHVRMS